MAMVTHDVDRQSQFFWTLLALLGAVLCIAGWARLLIG
jgi:hypothetical protein